MEVQDIVRLLRSGDTAPLKYLFEQYGSYCQRLLRQRTGCSREEAQDILMDALLAFRHNAISGKLTEVNHPKTYLYTICYYLYRAQQQRQQREAVQQEEAGRVLYGLDEPAVYREQASARQQRVNEAFGQLSARCQELLRYFYVDRKSLADIAQRMEINSVDAVKTSRYRCFQRWKDLIEKGV